MARIAIAGFQHETNTFAPLKAALVDFELRNDWPPLSRGERLLAKLEEGIHLPITGAFQALSGAGHTIVPLLWCSAMPSDRVTRGAFETICGQLIDMLEDQWPVDGLYLDLHGAMVCEHLEDGEGELLHRLRDRFGESVPIAVSLDLHANITEQMVQHASLIDCFREYPHNDMGECGARTAHSLMRLLEDNVGYAKYKVLHKLPYQIPLTQGCTYVDPAKQVYELVNAYSRRDNIASVVFACGFPLADIEETGPAVLVTGSDQVQVELIADEFLNELLARESDFALIASSPREAIARALEILPTAKGPVVFADTQDNPGGGGAGDTVGIFKELLVSQVDSAVVAMVVAPELAKAAHDAGVGQVISGELGEWSGFTGEQPFKGKFEVVSLGDGSCVGTGLMWFGAKMDMGLCALLQIDGVRVMIGSVNMQLADQSMLRHLGVEPAEEKILVLKSSVHFRNDFQELAEEVIVVTSPGPVTADLGELHYRRLRPQLRVTPARRAS